MSEIKPVLIEDYGDGVHMDTRLGYASTVEEAMSLVQKYGASGTWYVHIWPDRFHVMNGISSGGLAVKMEVK